MLRGVHVVENMFRPAHADQGGDDSGGRAGELQSALAVAGHSDLCGKPFGKVVRQLSLMKGGAGDRGYAMFARELEGWNVFVTGELGRQRVTFGHAQIEWKLDETEVVMVSASLMSQFEALGERDISLIAVRDPERVPRGDSI